MAKKAVLATKQAVKKTTTTVKTATKKVVKEVKSTVNQAIAFTKSGEAKQTLSIIVDFIPFIGNGKAAFESAYGYNPITKEEFSTVDRAIGVAGIVFGGLGKVVGKGGGVTIDAVIDAVSTDKKITNVAVETSKKNKKTENENTKGTGEYTKVGGHHVHAKAAFKENVNYDPKKGFSISQSFMKDNGLNHQQMTNKQRELFKELNESGRPNTLQEHTRIGVEALVAGGATRQEARDLVASSLKNLRQQGVKEPSNIPWYK